MIHITKEMTDLYVSPKISRPKGLNRGYLIEKEVWPACLQAAFARKEERLCLDCVIHYLKIVMFFEAIHISYIV